ncbi:sugar O-acetyltransferase [Lacticaseibacillus daqingensis]|uniref:sugar O-acetyltransferase n=1 Tax=Lacticaseibacillus daqingensis TaxID=2486014 RepID=UPI000F7AB05A|nr:sugar O-acetyltransferase [Lacticaseibacillus daqingensis]
MSKDHERMVTGQLYDASAPDLALARKTAQRRLFAYNQLAPEATAERAALLATMVDCPSEDAHIEAPAHMDYGVNIHIGRRFYANYDVIMLDVAPITIGDDVMFGPRVGLYTAGHPLDAGVRTDGLEYGHPITIGNRVWLGGSVTVCPGVTIGDNVVVGAGSVVTKDLPANVVAAGVPARPIRPLTDADTRYWRAEQAAYEQEENE